MKIKTKIKTTLPSGESYSIDDEVTASNCFSGEDQIMSTLIEGKDYWFDLERKCDQERINKILNPPKSTFERCVAFCEEFFKKVL